ncbi:MAG: hypothetical protein DRG82_07645 [Deltaproteobacteria bacterium]|nr:MAG: hypothetical protein B1H13_04595 [Desulfobacteraceae bacterium 4484_190.3]RLB17031.1 MAG: hypothetical protein DRG82_07645 [Deltaproteobacteria bacterium]
MESLQISLQDLARLCHLASLGKHLGGLIHNLNSPLHSLGMQMDVMQHFILKKNEFSDDVSEKLSKRLTQMNEEFENLNNQIRIAGMRADLLDSAPERIDINHFLHQEMQFLKTNLYFKHNVETTLELSPSLKAITPSLPYFNLAMGLFLERVAEELEKHKSSTLFIGTSVVEARPVISMRMNDTALSKPFCAILEMNPRDIPSMQEASEEMNLLISVLLLKNGGVTFKIDMNDQNTLLNLLFPEKAL